MASVEAVGAAELAATLRRAGSELQDMTATNAEVADYLAAASRSAAPVLSGRLRATIRGNRAATEAAVTAGGPGVPYAGPIHWGWAARNIRAHPFLVQPAERTEAVWTDMYLSGVQRTVDRIHGE